ncbi:hypothetical protein ACFOYU_18535 [Microvirga sp. GCM10011540]|uniref:hypothetical protein n=1 Tax=Microvirga sp. GCM10011540 TaxID=3317338 RepID=UPI003606E061
MKTLAFQRGRTVSRLCFPADASGDMGILSNTAFCRAELLSLQRANNPGNQARLPARTEKRSV